MSQAIQTRDELLLALDAAVIDEATPAVDYGAEVMGRDMLADATGGTVRPSHALDATKNPDGVAVMEYDRERFFLATKLVTTSRGDFVLLTAGPETKQSRNIAAAYRVYSPDATTLATTPTAAFAHLLEQHGVPYRNGDTRVRFVPTLEIQQGPSMEAQAINADIVRELDLPVGEGVSLTFNMAIRSAGPNKPLRLAWPYVIDRKSYLSSIPR